MTNIILTVDESLLKATCTFRLDECHKAKSIEYVSDIIQNVHGPAYFPPIIFFFSSQVGFQGQSQNGRQSLDKKEKSSQTATKVVQLQQMLPSIRVIYCSATSVSHPRNLGFMRWVTFILFVFAEYYLCFMYHVVNIL